MKAVRYITLAILVVLMNSCIFKNEMAYPRVFAEILDIELEGEASRANIDRVNMTVNLLLDEKADLSSVKVLRCKMTEGATCEELKEGSMLNLIDTLSVTLKNYHDYVWKLVAKQQVDRYIICDYINSKKIQWNEKDHSARIPVSPAGDIKALEISSIKIGPYGSTIENLDLSQPIDCSQPVKAVVSMNGEDIEWTLDFYYKDLSLEVTSVSPWCYHAIAMVEFAGEQDVKVEYRQEDESDWILAGTLVKGNKYEGEFDLKNLKEETYYYVRCLQGTSISNEYRFKTYKAEQLPNMNFEQWSNNGKVWYPYLDKGKENVWDTANEGASFGPGKSTTRADEHCVEGKYSARMETISVFGSMAAGNLFTGYFDDFNFNKLEAHLFWGIPYNNRPKSLKGWYDYAPKKIKAEPTMLLAGGAPNPYFDKKGQTDKLQILIALLADHDDVFKDKDGNILKSGYEVYSTMPGKPDLRKETWRNDPRIIACNEWLCDENTNGKFKEFELEFEYRQGDNRKPAYIIVVACSSAYGNFFTGGIGSVLYVDDFKFEFE